MIVAVRGRAGSQEPVTAEMTGTQSVIAEIMEELSSKTQNERGEWTSESQIVQQQRWEAAWFLTDETAMRVDVAGSMHAELIKETYEIAKEFRAGQRSMCNKIIDRLTSCFSRTRNFQVLNLGVISRWAFVGRNVVCQWGHR